MSKINTIALWVLAVLLTAGIAIYQRLTGPTHPVRGEERISDATVKYKFLRSYTENSPLPVKIHGVAKKNEAFLLFRRFESGEEWTEIKMEQEENKSIAYIPGLPPAGKMEYTVKIKSGDSTHFLNNGKTIVARFKGDVPSIFLILHIIFMFFGILFGLRTGMEAAIKNGNYKWMVYATLLITVGGGLILGPIVQKYAFGSLWTGVPFGYDLTDNKMLIAVIAWSIALYKTRKNRSRWWVVAAAALMVIVYLIPHSVLGSELDPATGKMKQLFG